MMEAISQMQGGHRLIDGSNCSSERESRITDRKHDALKLFMDGNHIKKIRNPKSILDVGTGKGAWAVEMAHEFATADEVVGVDIESVAPLHYPANCRFEVHPLVALLIPDRGYMQRNSLP
jgi:hypothetical protein